MLLIHSLSKNNLNLKFVSRSICCTLKYNLKLNYVSSHSIISCSNNHNKKLSIKSSCIRDPHTIIQRQISYQHFILSIATSQPVSLCESLLINCHAWTHLSWWASIVLTTFIVRIFITFPFGIFQNNTLSRLQNLQPEIKKIAEELKAEVAVAYKLYKWDEKTARYAYNKNLERHIKNLIIRDNCHPFKTTIMVWIQLPVWICLSFALRNMTGLLPFSSVVEKSFCFDMAWEGIFWFPNLLMPDSTWIIPVILGITNLCIIEMYALRRPEKITKFQKGLTYFLRGLSILMVPVAASVPVALSLYWTSSSLFGLGQNVILLFPKVRRFFKIPPVANESQTPVSDLITLFKLKWKIG